MNVIKLRRHVRIYPHQLTSDLKNVILTESSKQLQNDCSEDMGYITKLIDVEQIIDNHIENSSSDIVIYVSLLAEVFKPVVNNIENAKVIAIYNDGTLLEINNIQKILIPNNAYKSKYITVDNKLTPIEKGTREIKINDIIPVRIKAIRYNNHSFSCIGEFEKL
jgi:DNA-directed RNA polymerase subunit E'/Rpb7